jgi:hypothetical protein
MRHQLNVTRNVPQILTHLNLWAYIDSYLLAAAVSTILYDTHPLYYYFTVTHIHFWHSYQHIDQPITHPHMAGALLLRCTKSPPKNKAHP